MKTTPKKIIAWVDDDRSDFDRVSKQWPEDNEYQLRYFDLKAMAGDDDDPLEKLVEEAPDILVIDWQEGLYKKIYQVLQERVKRTILISVTPPDGLKDVFEQYPSLKPYTLKRPFDVAQLLAWLPSGVDVSTSGLSDDRSKRSGSVASKLVRILRRSRVEVESIVDSEETADIGDTLPLRYLGTDGTPIDTSPAWRDSPNRPELPWSEDALKKLQQHGQYHHVLHCPNPASPDEFRLMQFSTYAMAKPVQDRIYIQFATPVERDLAERSLSFDGSTLQGILDLMRQAGFARGRFYRVTAVPGLVRPMLELTLQEPMPQGCVLPIAVEMDDEEEQQFLSHAGRVNTMDFNGQLATLIFEVRAVNENALTSNNDRLVWKTAVPDVGIQERLEVPLYRDHCDSKAQGSNLICGCLQGMFVFDLGRAGNINDRPERPEKSRLIEIVKASLLAALKYQHETYRYELAQHERIQAEQLMKFLERLNGVNDTVDIATAYVNEALEFVATPSFDESNNGGVGTNQRSAIFAHYDELRQVLKVTADTSGKMLGYGFPLTANKFVLVKAANLALEFLQSGNFAQAATPVFVPDMKKLYSESRIERIALTDWQQVENCPVDEHQRNQTLVESEIATVVALPVVDGKVLLGVLLVRSSLKWEYTQRRVQGLQALVKAATPHLARLRAQHQRDEWAGTAWHEMRSHLARANTKIDVAQFAKSPEQRELALQDAGMLLSAGHELAALHLAYTVGGDTKTDRPTDAAFWDYMNRFGQMLGRQHVKLAWKMQISPLPHALYSQRLKRVLFVLLDNAFKYADHRQGDTIVFESAPQVFQGYVRDQKPMLVFRIANPGQGDLVQLNLSDQPLRTRVGLALIYRACQEIGATLSFYNEGDPNEHSDRGEHSKLVVARLVWPCEAFR